MNPPIYTGSKIFDNTEEECKASMLHDSMDLSRLMINFQQVEESRKRKHTRAGNMSRQVEENFSRKIKTAIRDKPRFIKELFHQRESSSVKVRHDRDSEPRIMRYNVVCEKERWKS